MSGYQSESEKNGLSCLSDDDLMVLSVGISTGGKAEITMAQKSKNRQIVATSLDESGIASTKALIKEAGLSKRIIIKHEDVSEPLSYSDETFDYIYARLVLHYLSNEKLSYALKNLFRITKKNGRIFIVVRSVDSDEAKQENNIFDAATRLTTYMTVGGHTATRYFHTVDSISDAVVKTGWHILHMKQYDEMLNASFDRKGIWVNNNVIELLAVKP